MEPKYSKLEQKIVESILICTGSEPEWDEKHEKIRRKGQFQFWHPDQMIGEFREKLFDRRKY